MNRFRKGSLIACVVFFAAPLAAQEKIRVGYMPNITHAIPLAGVGEGAFQEAFRPTGVTVETAIFNAGPSAVEALFAGAIDLAYVGPIPAINAHVKSRGAVQVIAGACSGGAALVVRADARIQSPADFQGKRIATPQIGNSQDVAARIWLAEHGLKTADKGGKVWVLPIRNADQITLMIKKQLDAAWTCEPWVSRLIGEAGGQVFLDERSLWPNGRFATTVVVVKRAFLKAHPERVKIWLRAHVDLARRFRKDTRVFFPALNQELQRLTTKALPESVLTEAFGRLEVTEDPLNDTLLKMARDAYRLGYLGKNEPDLSQLMDETLLHEVLKERSDARRSGH